MRWQGQGILITARTLYLIVCVYVCVCACADLALCTHVCLRYLQYSELAFGMGGTVGVAQLPGEGQTKSLSATQA